MDRSKVLEWLLDNDCPFEWEVDDNGISLDSITIAFSDKEEGL